MVYSGSPGWLGSLEKGRERAWPISSRLDGEGASGRLLGTVGGGVLTALSTEKKLQCSVLNKLSLRIFKAGKGAGSETSLGGSGA